MAFATIFGIALLGFSLAAQNLSDANDLKAFEPEEVHALVMTFLDAFRYLWLIGLVCFGFHVLTNSYLILLSNCIPRILGFLLLLEGIGPADR